MLHIILLILKIIGIILLCILGIVLLVLSAILFIPIRYKVDIRMDKYGSAGCVVSWFLHAFSINLKYDKDKNGEMAFDKYVKILGIRTGLLFGKKTEDTKKEAAPEEVREDRKKQAEKNAPVLENKSDYSEPVKTEEIEASFSDRTLSPFPDTDETASPDKESIPEKDPLLTRIKDFFYKILVKLKKIRFKIKSIYGRMKAVYKKAVSIKEFLEMEETKEALSFLKTQAGALIKHIKPKKVTGHLKFGTGSPAMTGELLGLIYIFFKGANDKFIIEADFDNKVLEGEACLKGRVTVFSILLIAIKVYRNENLKNTINRGKNLKEE